MDVEKRDDPHGDDNGDEDEDEPVEKKDDPHGEDGDHAIFVAGSSPQTN